MTNIVLCSELGRGSKHLAKLADYTMQLQAQEHSVKLVCRDLAAANMLPQLSKIPIFPAPHADIDPLLRSRQSDERPKNYSSVLLMNGYGDSATLLPLLRCWIHFLVTLEADLIVADHSPTALLAAKLLDIPSIMTGTGFTVPPAIHPMPSVAPWRVSMDGKAAVQSELFVEDKKLLHSINETVSALNFDKLKFTEVNQIFSHAAQWLVTLPEMDHYGRRKVSYVVRWMNREENMAPVWPDVAGDKVFVYMDAEAPHLPILLAQLKEVNDPVLAVIPNADDAFIEQYQSPSIRIQRELVNIRRVSEQCNVFINHCGHNLVYELLMMGVPSVFLPNNPENTMLAYRLAKKKIGFAGPAKPRKLDIQKLLESVKKHDQIWHNASRLALKHQNRKSLRRLHDLIAEKLPKISA
jgi:UDP:flavonoid glycosyltransferase YjiC (YdhE family)